MHHETVEAACQFLVDSFGAPTHVITTTASAQEITNRFKESKEMGAGDELGEEDQ